ncbi:MAG: SIMPL domain-containing protein [Candidatus Dormibacteraeota bacterium]|nr:SIMPL domain-containing protein [Candidatus Dormibacteraeota bacterium]
MPRAVPLVIASIAIVTACAVVTVLVLAAGRPPVLLSTAAGATVSTTTLTSGVITSGDATVSKKPDIAYLSVGVESQQSTASAAQSDLAGKAAKMIARAKALGIVDKDISTSGYWVGPYYASNSQTITGYRAAEQLRLKWHNVDTAGNAIDGLVQEGGAMTVGVSFGLADAKAAQAEARTLAVADAHSRAQAMAAAAGVKLGQVVRISDITFSGYPSVGYDIKAAAPAATQVPVGELEVKVTVEVAYAIA